MSTQDNKNDLKLETTKFPKQLMNKKIKGWNTAYMMKLYTGRKSIDACFKRTLLVVDSDEGTIWMWRTILRQHFTHNLHFTPAHFLIRWLKTASLAGWSELKHNVGGLQTTENHRFPLCEPMQKRIQSVAWSRTSKHTGWVNSPTGVLSGC